jgi:hypothetical protein
MLRCWRKRFGLRARRKGQGECRRKASGCDGIAGVERRPHGTGHHLRVKAALRAYLRQRQTHGDPSVEGGFGGLGTGVVGTLTFGTAGRRGFGGRSCFGTSSYGMAVPPDGYGG